MVCPCKNCTEETGRKIGCHGYCERYIEWKEKRDKAIENMKKDYSYCRSEMTFAQRRHWKEQLKRQKGDMI